MIATVHSKRFRAGAEKMDRKKLYGVREAVQVLQAFPRVKFDESVELSIQLGIKTGANDQAVRGSVVLPHGTGKVRRVLVFVKGEKTQEARDAGADYVGCDDMIQKISGGWLDFDVVIAHPEVMAQISRLGKVLGPRGLMPNPKTGTVTVNLAAAIADFKRGRLEFKSDKDNGIHAGIGKVSFTVDQLEQNAEAFLEAVGRARPASAKGDYLKSASITTTMGPGLKLDISRRMVAVEE